jgi:hypothetical protein
VSHFGLGKLRARARYGCALVAAMSGFGLALVLVDAQAGADSSYPDAITGGQTLTSGSILESPDGHYQATFTDGVLNVNITGGANLFTEGTAQAGAYAVLQPNGLLVTFAANGQVLWSSGTTGTGCPVLEMQLDGNLVDYDTTHIWDAGSTQFKMHGGDLLTAGQAIYSTGDAYRLSMNPSGDLVLYNDSNKVIWKSDTAGHAGAYADMQTDGNLVVYSAAHKALWSTETKSAGARLDVQSDGNLVIYSKADSTVLWQSKTTKMAGTGSPFSVQEVDASPVPCPSSVAPPTTTVVDTQTQTVTSTQTVLVPTTTVLTVAAPAPTKLKRFDVKVATRWAYKGDTTILQGIAVGKLPKGVELTATYNPHLKRHKPTVQHGFRGKTLVALVKHIRAIKYRPGQTLNINLTRKGYEHEWATFTFRSGKLPLIRPVAKKR